MKAYGVWCQVSGGRTGSRASWLKSNGTVRLFDTFEAAQEVATELMLHGPGTNPHRTADFRYTAREMPCVEIVHMTPTDEGVKEIHDTLSRWFS